MEVNKDRYYRIKWFWNILKNGLFLFGVRNRLARIGFDIDPFYWVLEGDLTCESPKIKGDPSAYEFTQLNAEEITSIKKKIHGNDDAAGLPNFHDQQICIGLEYKGEVAAFMIIELNDFNYNRKKFHLKENEAYLFHMYTFEAHRGKNLAPYLRYQSYLMLKDMGRNRIYSITQFFNKSSKRFKKKLNARHLQLFMYIILFKKYHYHFLIKNYDS
ncbi:MAG: GNAT family N-acetyltransferase [Eudoraea sp.]|uniref:GNAT family N-acetyltransferase n=1 Tax=Eudoraea sp. TaxID=1979955 RepID=UPI003C71D5E7